MWVTKEPQQKDFLVLRMKKKDMKHNMLISYDFTYIMVYCFMSEGALVLNSTDGSLQTVDVLFIDRYLNHPVVH